MVASSITLTPARPLSHSDEVLIRGVGCDEMLLDLTSKQYFDLEPAEMRIGPLTGGADRLQAVSERPCCEHDADPARISDKPLALMEKLAAAVAVKLD